VIVISLYPGVFIGLAIYERNFIVVVLAFKA